MTHFFALITNNHEEYCKVAPETSETPITSIYLEQETTSQLPKPLPKTPNIPKVLIPAFITVQDGPIIPGGPFTKPLSS